MADNSKSSKRVNWDLYAPNWRSYLDRLENEGVKKPRSEEAHKYPWPSKITYKDVTDYEAMKGFDLHAAHVMLWCHAKDTDVLIDKYPLQYRIMMQLRFDGRLGFPGGEIDEIADFTFGPDNFEAYLEVVKQGLIREVREEMELELKSNPKYILTSLPEGITEAKHKSCILHFFSAEITLEAMESMERNLSKILSNDEVLGLTRVPLCLMVDREETRIRGFPVFLNNSFAGNSAEQLMKACLVEGLLTEDQVTVAYHLARDLAKTT